jgi:hypothetical protein
MIFEGIKQGIGWSVEFLDWTSIYRFVFRRYVNTVLFCIINRL